jgi:hypothetical protein
MLMGMATGDMGRWPRLLCYVMLMGIALWLMGANVDMGRWPRLAQLELCFNQLQSLPASLGQCLALVCLDVSNNQVRRVGVVVGCYLTHDVAA